MKRQHFTVIQGSKTWCSANQESICKYTFLCPVHFLHNSEQKTPINKNMQVLKLQILREKNTCRVIWRSQHRTHAITLPTTGSLPPFSPQATMMNRSEQKKQENAKLENSKLAFLNILN